MDAASRLPTERELFEAAVCLQADEVPAFLNEKCPDETLRAQVAALLALATAAGAAQLMPDEPADWTRLLGEEKPGSLIGRFRLERIIGQGGFGVVWLAHQQEPVQRKVALKILKPGLDTGAVITRFAAERQVLAMMDHPNVAHVYDAGSTPAGRPYFAMEYLDGEPLFSYATTRKLTVGERLRLMQQAASAVQHAHQKGIIHRDLKPSNIIVVEVDGGPLPKIIDFGIAKVVSAEPGTDLTMAGQSWGTPAYMSPEQIDGEPADTRTDVYSFGVILFELITGVRPPTRGPKPCVESLIPSRRITGMALAESSAAAAERSTTPRELTGLLRGELDWIVMKATATDPAQRYESAGALRDDLLRFQAGQPVSAGPPGNWYRTGKFIRRHKMALAAFAAVVLALIAGTVVSAMYARRAHEATLVMSDALYDARITEALAIRQSGRPGQRLRSLAAVKAAAKLRQTPELRDEALAAMALPDVALVASLEVIPETSPVFDYDFASDLLVVGRHDRTEILRYRLSTGEALGPIPLPLRLSGSFKFCLSPGGDVIAVYPAQIFGAVDLKDLTFYETSSGRKLCEVAQVDFDCDGCAFLDGGTRAVVPMLDGSLSVVNVHLGVEERRIKTGGRINQVRGDAAGARLLACRSNERTVLLIDAAEGTVIRSLAVRGNGVVADFSPDGRLAVFGDQTGSIVTMDLIAARDEKSIPAMELNGHRDAIASVDFVLDGQCVVSAAWDNTVRLWSPGGQQLLVMEAARVMAAPGGGRLLVWQGKRVQLIDLVPAVECRAVCQTSTQSRARTAFTPDAKYVATQTGGGTLVCTWPACRPVARFSGRAFAFGANGATLYTSGSGGIRQWNMAAVPANVPARSFTEDESTPVVSGPWGQCAASPDGRWLASTTSYNVEKPKIEVFSLATGASVASMPWTNAGVETLVFDPARQWMAASWWRGRGFTVWDTANWNSVASRETEVESLVLAVSDDGQYLASCSASELCLWVTKDWRPLRRVAAEPFSASARAVAIAPHGELVAFECEPSRIRLLHPGTGATAATLTLPLRDPVHHLTFSPNGMTLSVSTPARTWFFDLSLMKRHLQKLGLDFGS